jgi:hypothetical protein
MLRLLGLNQNPAIVALIGAALLAIGIGKHATFLLIVGAGLIIWSGIGAITRGRRER